MVDDRPHFLVIRLSSIGDIVHALPAVAALGQSFPQAEIDWVVEVRHAYLLEGNPYVRRVLRFDTLGWRKTPTSPRAMEELARSLVALREVPYNAAIDFQGLYKSALIGWLSRARERLGFAEYWLREPAAAVFYTEHIAPRNRDHVIQMNLALVEPLGARPGSWQFPLPRNSEDDRYVEERLASLGVRDFIVISPGGGWKSKCWPPENYAELIRRLDQQGRVFLTGAPEEEALNHAILRGAGSGQASYFTCTIVQLIALLRRARLFVGGDTGPLHLAAAVGTPIVGIYGSTEPRRNGPFSAADIAISSKVAIPETRRTRNADYLRGVSVDSVLAAIGQRLATAYE